LRSIQRQDIQVTTLLPFHGIDIWNHYEVSWLNTKGKPIVATAQIIYDCTSPHLIESKSMKLYFNSFNNTSFPDMTAIQQIMVRDLTARVGAPVTVNLFPLHASPLATTHSTSTSLDDLDIACSIYHLNPDFLFTEDEMVEETISSNLLKSNCLVTQQPDWGSVQITYKGKKINHIGLLQYIVSFREHYEFGEHCVERMFMDIMQRCKPKVLTIYGRYTRRGGLDINVYRTTEAQMLPITTDKLYRQ
jgi:7-cyano-7-deazaguanine reductase